MLRKLTTKLKPKSTNTITIPEVSTTSTTYIDLARLVAETKALPLLWGEGWRLEGEKSYAYDRLVEILDNNGIDGLFKSSEIELSMREEGNQLFIVQPSMDNQVLVNIADMNNTIYQGDQNGHLEGARVSSTMQSGAYEFQVVQTFANGWMHTIINKRNTTGAFDIPVSVPEFNNVTGNRLVTNWNYGKVIPLVMFTNRSSSGLKDSGDAIAARPLQDLLDTTFTVNNNETLLNTTKVLLNQLPAEIKAKNTSLDSKAIEQLFIQTDMTDEKIKLLVADPKLSSYWEQINNIKDEYMLASGYSTENDFNGTQTQVGVMFQGKKDIETTRIKNESRTKQVNELLELVIMVDSMINIDIYSGKAFNIVIDSFNVIDAADRDTRVEKMVELGIITKRDLIKHYYDIQDDDRVDEILAELDKENVNTIEEENNE